MVDFKNHSVARAHLGKSEMIRFLTGNGWNEEWAIKEPGKFCVDLRGLSDEDSIIGAFWNELRGPGFPASNYPGKGYVASLDALEEVIGDFFAARWVESTTITIVGGNSLNKVGPFFPAFVVDTLNSAIYLAVREKSVESRNVNEICEGIDNITIWLILN